MMGVEVCLENQIRK